MGFDVKRSCDCEMCVRLDVASFFGERIAAHGLDVRCLDISLILDAHYKVINSWH